MLQVVLNSAVSVRDQQFRRATRNIISFILTAAAFSFFMRWLAGINDEHAKFRVILSVKALADKRVMDGVEGKYLEMLFKRRGCIYAGPLPVTMSLFGTMVTALSVIGPVLLLQTGLQAASTTYTCSEVVYPADLNCNISDFRYLTQDAL